MKKRMLALALALCLLLAVLPVTAGAAGEGSENVGTFAELKEAIRTGKKQITLTADITATAVLALPDGMTINGAGHTLQAKTTGVTEQGVMQKGSAYSIFTIASGRSVHVENLTIKGGSSTAVVNAGSLVMENVTVTQSGSSTAEGGGIKNTGKMLLKNCSIIRNVASFGAGILNAGSAVLVMDGCSLSENRSLSQGGGAAELKGSSTMYVNNSAICNNTSAEIGGGFNIYGATLYLMNSTVTGNATTAAASSGGGIGNNGGNLYAVNSIITDNYYVTESQEAVPSDIGHYSKGVNDLHFCLYGALKGTAITVDETNKAVAKDTKNIFANYVTAGILSGSGETKTKEYSRPILTRVSAEDDRLYAPLKDGSPALTGGTGTQFECSDDFVVKMSYWAGDTQCKLGTLDMADTGVTTYLEGGTRVSSVIGASGIGTAGGEATEYFTVWVNSAEGGTVTGGSVHGDSYAKGTMVTVKAVADEGYTFTRWLANGKAVSVEATYKFAVTEDVTLTPVFTTNSTPAVTYVTVTLNTSEGITGFQYRVNDAANWTPYAGAFKAESGSKVEVKALLEDNYTFVSWGNNVTSNPYTMTEVEADVNLTPTSTKDSASVEDCTVTVNKAEGGTVTGGNDSYVKGTEVTLTAKASEGYKFVKWLIGEQEVTDNPYMFTVTENVTLTPVFEEDSTPEVTYVTVTLNASVGITGFQYSVNDADWADYTEAFEIVSGSKVAVKAILEDNYTFAGWGNGETDNLYTAESLTEDLTLTPTTTYEPPKPVRPVRPTYTPPVEQKPEELPFDDVSKNDWFYDDVEYVYESGLMQGVRTRTFEPNAPITRGMIVTILYRMEGWPAVSGSCVFQDVAPGSYYESAILWAAAQGIVKGYDDTHFGPDDSITREQLAAILMRYAAYKNQDTDVRASLNGFVDAGSISSYATNAVAWAVSGQLLAGVGGSRIAPAGNATRAQAAAILHRFLTK